MKPDKILRTTPKEFHLLMDAEQEKIYDNMEIKATEAMMIRAAYHAKKLKTEDLFDRKKAKNQKPETQENMREKIRKQQEWLDNLNIGKGGEHGK